MGGFAVGAASLLSPLYIAEISPARIRGALVGLNQMAIVTGILLSYLANWGLSFFGSESWRWMFAVAAIPALFLLVAMLYVPESPRWLTEKGREDEALAVLERAAGTEEATTAINELRESIKLESGKLSELFEPRMRRSLVIALVMAVMQQWVGVNTLLFYGSITLNDVLGWKAQTAGAPALGALALIGGVNFLATILALYLIDRIGRKALLIISAGAMAVCWIGLAVLFAQPHPPAVAVVVAMTAAAAIIIRRPCKLTRPGLRPAVSASPRAALFGMTAAITKCRPTIGSGVRIPRAKKLAFAFAARCCPLKIWRSQM